MSETHPWGSEADAVPFDRMVSDASTLGSLHERRPPNLEDIDIPGSPEAAFTQRSESTSTPLSFGRKTPRIVGPNLAATESHRPLGERFEIDPVPLGEGSFSTVHRGRRRSDGKAIALKTMPRKRIKAMHLVRNELELQRFVDHPNIVKLLDIIEDSAAIHAVQELALGGDLYDCMAARCETEGLPGEPTAAKVMRQVLAAVQHLHSRRIAHRDVKMENFVLEREGVPVELNTVKLTDFGFARRLGTTGMTTVCGTPEYSAPELLKGEAYSEKCDVWSCGIMAYVIFDGTFPFSGSTEAQVVAAVVRGRVRFNGGAWPGISSQAKDYIKNLLESDPYARPSAKTASGLRWLVNSF